jgi:hypothetical protein
LKSSNYNDLTPLEMKIFLSVPKMWLLSKGKVSIFQVIPSKFKENKKLEFNNAFGSITKMNARCVLSCDTHGGSKSCGCVFVGLRDHTACTGSGVNNSDNLMEDDNVDIDESGRYWIHSIKLLLNKVS